MAGKIINKDTSDEMTKTPAKRGRKPKVSTETPVEVVAEAPKKRGRKPKSETTAVSKKNTAKKRTTKPKVEKILRPQEDNEIFALDIGTRNVVGVLGSFSDGIYTVKSAVSHEHSERAMIDGQIEDITEVARVVAEVKKSLEEKTGVSLSRVAIAAAGRALKTKSLSLEYDIDEKEVITEDIVRSFEVETVLYAQEELDAENEKTAMIFYCVGHTVVNYFLDGYKIKSLVGHKGKKIKVELIAAFLPSVVIESLYSVMDINSLEVASLTLEPIAAMNVIIPPEVRLINIALVDIGAGTSDIAISQNGSIVAYAMSTVAGDEITEEIIRKYIVDFETAERMKLQSNKDIIKFTDILGFSHEISSEEFYAGLQNIVNDLASNIAENIVIANGQAPAAVFLVGGGSLIPELPTILAEKLEIPADRVAVGGKNPYKNISLGKVKIHGPEFVTPIGIGVTATYNKGYDFSVVMLNDKKMRIFDTRTITVIDLLMLAGYKSNQIIGRSGRNLSFNLNGQKQTLKGEPSVAGEISINGNPVSLEGIVKQGDVVSFTPAISGKSASVKISDIAGDTKPKTVFVDGKPYSFGIIPYIGEKIVSSDYAVQNFDEVFINEIYTLADLKEFFPFDAEKVSYYKLGKLLNFDYVLSENDDIIIGEKVYNENSAFGKIAKAVVEKKVEPVSETVAVEEVTISAPPTENAVVQEEVFADADVFRVILNGSSVVLPPNVNNPDHELIELMSIASIDLDNPPPSGNMITNINGKPSGFMDKFNFGDNVVIKWADN